MRINVDMDGVLYDFVGDAREEFYRHYGEANVEAPDPDGWGIWDHWRVREPATDLWHIPSGNHFWRIVDQGVMAGRVFGNPHSVFPGAGEFLTALIEAGHSVHIVTSKALKDLDVRWQAFRNVVDVLEDLQVPVDSVVFCTGDKSCFPADVVIDDNPRLERWVQDDALNILAAQPWNAKLDDDRVYRLDNYWDMLDQIAIDDVLVPIRPAQAEPEPPELVSEAVTLVYGDRQGDYGHPADDFGRTAQIWSAILGTEVTAEDVALCMVGVKLSREVNAPKADNVVDAHGYLLTYGRVRRRREGLE